jgi:hypothetical protein
LKAGGYLQSRAGFHLIIDDADDALLVELVGPVDVTHLGVHGATTAEEIWGIDESLLTVLGLS